MKTKSTRVEVRAIKTAHPQGYRWRVYFPNGGGIRRCRFFTTQTEALKFQKGKQAELGQSGNTFGVLSTDERAAVEQWRAIRLEAGRKKIPVATLAEIVEREANRWRASIAPVTVEDAKDRLLAVKRAEGVTAARIAQLASLLGKFTQAFPGRPVGSFATVELTDWLIGLPLSPKSKQHLRTALVGLFGQAVTDGTITANPAEATLRVSDKDRPVAGVLKPEATKALLAKLDKRLVPVVALGLFGGLRSAEILRLDWQAIDFAAGEVHLAASITKTRHPRTVEMLPALRAWLEPHRRESGPVVTLKQSSVIHGITEGAKAAGVSVPKNFARHTYASAHLFHFKHAGKTALQLGHGGNPELLHSHYKGVMSEAEAAEHWNIRP